MQFARYELSNALAVHPMAFPAVRTSDGTQVVICRLDPKGGDTTAFVTRLRELTAAELPKVLDDGSEATSGPSGGAWVATEPWSPAGFSQLPPAQRSVRVVAACRGAAALHAAGLAHGSISPQALVDLGIPAAGATRPGLSLPSLDDPTLALGPDTKAQDLDWHDPQVLWGEGATSAGDVWALGALAARCDSDQPLYPEAASHNSVGRVQTLLKVRPHLGTGGVWDVIRACFAPDARNRPSADELASALGERLS